MFVGVGASRVRDLFEQGKKNAPCIIFIDEIDAVGRHRGAGLGGGHDEREQTLNQLLVEMDGFESNEGVILLAATNRPDVLDPALLRPGRFDRQIVVDMPDINGREAILKVHMKKVRVAAEVSAQQIAAGTPGMAGADLENLVNEAALLAARKNHDFVTMDDFEDAKEKVMLGPERRSRVFTRRGQARGRLPRERARGGGLQLQALRPGAQGHHHPARPGPGPDRDDPRGGPVHDLRAQVPRPDLRRPRRARGRGPLPGQDRVGRLWGHQGRHQLRADHGHPLGHEREAGADRVRGSGRTGLPRPRLTGVTTRSAKRRCRRSTRRSSGSSANNSSGPARSSPATGTRSRSWRPPCWSGRPWTRGNSSC